jgi:hypothetical protein
MLYRLNGEMHLLDSILCWKEGNSTEIHMYIKHEERAIRNHCRQIYLSTSLAASPRSGLLCLLLRIWTSGSVISLLIVKQTAPVTAMAMIPMMGYAPGSINQASLKVFSRYTRLLPAATEDENLFET